MPKLTFGHVDGVEVGDEFPRYADLNKAGVHRPSVAGIGGRAAEGADSIVLNGGYKDDIDLGDRILYTGQGGQDQSGNQVTDQQWSLGNEALRKNLLWGLPVRVIRGWKGDPRHSPSTGYRYDGLYAVTDAQMVRSSDGPLVCRFTLEWLEDQ